MERGVCVVPRARDAQAGAGGQPAPGSLSQGPGAPRPPESVTWGFPFGWDPGGGCGASATLVAITGPFLGAEEGGGGGGKG